MSKVFDAYASYYDALYRDKDYAAEAQYVASHITRHSPGAATILKLGCGTGAHAEHLARAGFEVHGVDFSPAMLAGAQARRSSLRTDIAARLSFELGDVRSIQTDGRYDVVLSLFHVLSYHVTNADLKAVIDTAARHLTPGGLLMFDFWYGPAVLSQKPSVRVKRFEDDSIRVVRIGEPDLCDAENVVRVNYQVLIEDKSSGTLHEVREIHPMRYLFLPEIESLLESSSLVKIGTYEWMTSSPPTAESWNVCALARSPR